MFKVIGVDGKEYGPVSLDQLRQWKIDGRIGPVTQVLEPDATAWKPASRTGALADLFSPPPPIPGTPQPNRETELERGLAVTSFGLGMLSLVCAGPLTGIPAIICGHLAHHRARTAPDKYGGAGFAITGLILGYLGTVLISAIFFGSFFVKATAQSSSVGCLRNLKQVGLAVKLWQIEHGDQLPFQITTNAGGTLEFASSPAGHFDSNSHLHFQVLSNELNSPGVLVCPGDKGATVARSFRLLGPGNISYRLQTDATVNATNFNKILGDCPIHKHILYLDGSVHPGDKPAPRWMD